jgi:hypothetical protein
LTKARNPGAWIPSSLVISIRTKLLYPPELGLVFPGLRESWHPRHLLAESVWDWNGIVIAEAGIAEAALWLADR